MHTIAIVFTSSQLNRRLWLGTLVVLLATTGCGGDGRPALVRCSGKVLLDGKPLEGATVSLVQTQSAGGAETFARPSAGVTDAEGKFSLGTYSMDDGVPKGEYRVAIIKHVPAKEIPPGMSTESLPPEYSKMKWITPRKFGSVDTSGLTAKVTSSGLEPDVFELKSLPKMEIE